MEERCCSVCCDVKAKAAIGARPWRTPPSTLLRQALLACTLAQQSERRATNIVSSPLLTAVAALNSYAGMLKTSEVSFGGKSLKRRANEHLVNWLCDVQSCRDLLDENIPVESASHPSILNIEKLGLPSDLGEAFLVENLCGCCEKLIRTFAKHERRCQTIATSLFKATVKSLINLAKSDNLVINHTSSNKKDITQKTFPEQSIALSDPSSKDVTVSTIALSLVTKRKRGRPNKVPPNFEALLPKRKKSDIDCAKSVCPFCSKVYSIEHSFVHNCLAYKNSLRCVKCNVFSSTYVRFEKHLEFFHHEKRFLCCQVSNCNQRFVSKPAFKWHSHFHTIEEKTVQRVYAEDINVVVGAASTVGKGEQVPDVCSDTAAFKIGATDDIDGPDVSSVTVISNDVDHVSSMRGCTDPADLLLSQSAVETKPQTVVPCILTNSSKGKSHLNWFNPSSKYVNQCPSIEMNKSQSLICLYNESENGNLTYTLPDDHQLARPMLPEAHSTRIASHNQHTSRAGSDGQNNTSSAEPASVFVGKQRNLSNLMSLDVRQRSRQESLVHGSKYHDQQQFVSISVSDFSINMKRITIPEYSPSITIDQASLNARPSAVPETHHSSEYTQLQCNGCQHYFPDQQTLDVHRISQCGKNGQQLFSCQRCSGSFLSPLNLKKHILSQCQSSGNGDGAQDTREDIIEESNFAQHIFMYHRVGEQQYQCPVCEQLFSIISDLVEHLNGHDSMETCTCYICSVNIKSNLSEAAQRDFITVESPSQIWTCAMCKVSFLTSEALKKHCTDANHNIGSLSTSEEQSSEQTTNLQMTNLDTNFLVHQLIHHDRSLHIKLADVKQEMISHDVNNPIPLSDSSRQIVVHNTNPSMTNYDTASTLTDNCPQSVVKVSVGLSSQSENNVVAIGSQFSGHATHSINAKQQNLQSFSDSSGSSSFQVGRPMHLQSSDVADTIPACNNLGFAGRAGNFSGESLLSVDARPVVHPKVTETESCNTSQPLFNNSESSYCQGCGVMIQDPTSLASHIRSCPLLQQKVEAPFVDDHFISTTENLSVIKALESSSGNALTSIDHLIGSVDDMDYFT